MPQGVYTGFECDEERENVFTPQEHQTYVLDYFLRSKFKGLLLYHKLGSGKTCTSIMIADAMIRNNTIKRVFVITPGSLRQGWLEEYCKVCGDDSQRLFSYFTFITYNYNVKNYLPEDFNDSLVIIDEVHNLINSVRNHAKNAVAIFNRIVLSNCRILALSGTPLYNRVVEWALLGNLLKPKTFPDREHFMSLFDSDPDGILTPKNPRNFNEKLKGIVSYFPGAGTEYYPTVIYEVPKMITMSKDQNYKFAEDYKYENSLLGKGPPTRPGANALPHTREAYEKERIKYILAKKRILSRQPSNFYYPPWAYRNVGKPDTIEKRPDGTLVRVKYPNKFEKIPDKVFPKGWVKPEYFIEGQLLKTYSPKMAVLIENIARNWHSKHVVFSFFKEKSGVNIIKAMLDMCALTFGGKKFKYSLFTGDKTSAQKQRLLTRFNKPDNMYGDKIRILFITYAGAEGITLKDVQHLHILESDVRENKIQQVIGRVVRYKSHINLPEDLRKVHIWRYWSVSIKRVPEHEVEYKTVTPTGQTKFLNMDIDFKTSIDELLYRNGLKQVNRLNSFSGLLVRASIESVERHQDIMSEIQFQPGLGAEYFRGKEEFESRAKTEG